MQKNVDRELSGVPAELSASTTNPVPITEITNSKELREKAEWLKKNIDRSINEAKRHRRVNQMRSTIIKVATISLSALATILLGLQIAGFENYFRDIAFVLGAIVTLLNALEPFFNYRALWVEHEVALANFHRIKDSLEFYLTGLDMQDLSAEKLNALHDEYQAIWENLNSAWIGYRRSENISSSK